MSRGHSYGSLLSIRARKRGHFAIRERCPPFSLIHLSTEFKGREGEARDDRISGFAVKAGNEFSSFHNSSYSSPASFFTSVLIIQAAGNWPCICCSQPLNCRAHVDGWNKHRQLNRGSSQTFTASWQLPARPHLPLLHLYTTPTIYSVYLTYSTTN